MHLKVAQGSAKPACSANAGLSSPCITGSVAAGVLTVVIRQKQLFPRLTVACVFWDRQQKVALSSQDEELLQQLLARKDVARTVLDALNHAQSAAAAAAAASGALTITCRQALVRQCLLLHGSRSSCTLQVLCQAECDCAVFLSQWSLTAARLARCCDCSTCDIDLWQTHMNDALVDREVVCHAGCCC